MQPVGGVPDLPDIQIGRGDTAVDPFCGLPPSVGVFDTQLARGCQACGGQGVAYPAVEVVGDAGPQVGREGGHAEIRPHVMVLSPDVMVHRFDAVLPAGELPHPGLAADPVETDGPHQRQDDPVRSTDDLKEGHGLLTPHPETESVP
ncbi:hypothetical protein AB0D45_10685 [Streptomyces sp. NPDC048352]|uniref:hypothetical protein n=1 Tax=Streptomyces sp. NPDC048352 TaxID=3154718 RepID=UPI003430588C